MIAPTGIAATRETCEGSPALGRMIQNGGTSRRATIRIAISGIEAREINRPLAQGGVLFTGSSSIRLWKTLAEDFPGVALANRGFGGSPVDIALSDAVVAGFHTSQSLTKVEFRTRSIPDQDIQCATLFETINPAVNT